MFIISICKNGLKCIRRALSFIGIAFALVSFIFLMWVTVGTVELDFISSLVSKKISLIIPDYTFDVEHVTTLGLAASDDGNVGLILEGVHIADHAGATDAHIDYVRIDFSLFDILFRKASPIINKIDGVNIEHVIDMSKNHFKTMNINRVINVVVMMLKCLFTEFDCSKIYNGTVVKNIEVDLYSNEGYLQSFRIDSINRVVDDGKVVINTTLKTKSNIDSKNIEASASCVKSVTDVSRALCSIDMSDMLSQGIFELTSWKLKKSKIYALALIEVDVINNVLPFARFDAKCSDVEIESDRLLQANVVEGKEKNAHLMNVFNIDIVANVFDNGAKFSIDKFQLTGDSIGNVLIKYQYNRSSLEDGGHIICKDVSYATLRKLMMLTLRKFDNIFLLNLLKFTGDSGKFSANGHWSRKSDNKYSLNNVDYDIKVKVDNLSVMRSKLSKYILPVDIKIAMKPGDVRFFASIIKRGKGVFNNDIECSIAHEYLSEDNVLKLRANIVTIDLAYFLQRLLPILNSNKDTIIHKVNIKDLHASILLDTVLHFQNIDGNNIVSLHNSMPHSCIVKIHSVKHGLVHIGTMPIVLNVKKNPNQHSIINIDFNDAILTTRSGALFKDINEKLAINAIMQTYIGNEKIGINISDFSVKKGDASILIGTSNIIFGSLDNIAMSVAISHYSVFDSDVSIHFDKMFDGRHQITISGKKLNLQPFFDKQSNVDIDKEVENDWNRIPATIAALKALTLRLKVNISEVMLSSDKKLNNIYIDINLHRGLLKTFNAQVDAVYGDEIGYISISSAFDSKFYVDGIITDINFLYYILGFELSANKLITGIVKFNGCQYDNYDIAFDIVADDALSNKLARNAAKLEAKAISPFLYYKHSKISMLYNDVEHIVKFINGKSYGMDYQTTVADFEMTADGYLNVNTGMIFLHGMVVHDGLINKIHSTASLLFRLLARNLGWNEKGFTGMKYEIKGYYYEEKEEKIVPLQGMFVTMFTIAIMAFIAVTGSFL